MLRDYSSEINHWRLVSRLLRVTGIAFIVGGILMAVYAIRAVLDPTAPFTVNGVADDRIGPRLLDAAMSLMFVLIGIALVSRRAYRPDLGDRNALDKLVDPFDTFGERRTSPYRGARSWWTGDPRQS